MADVNDEKIEGANPEQVAEVTGEVEQAASDNQVEGQAEEQAEEQASDQDGEPEAAADDAETETSEQDTAEAGASEQDAAEAQSEDVAEPQADGDQEAHEPNKAKGIGDLVIVGIFSIILGVLLCLPSFLSMGSAGSDADLSGGVAATVNGKAIGENDITNYITGFRTTMGYEDDEAFGQWMVQSGYTPESLRESAVSFFVEEQIVKDAMKENDVHIEDAAVVEQIAKMSGHEDLAGDEAALKEQLASEGVKLEDVMPNIKSSMEREALAHKVVTESAQVDDKMLLEMLKLYYPDEVPNETESLDGIDEEIVNSVREYLNASMLQQSFESWLAENVSKADVVVNDMPEGLPYNIDLSNIKVPEIDYSTMLENGDVDVETEEVELVDDETAPDGDAEAGAGDAETASSEASAK